MHTLCSMGKRAGKNPPLDFGGETLGQRLARLRKQRGFTQVELAEKVGITQVLISAYETDRAYFSVEMAVPNSMIAFELSEGWNSVLSRNACRASGSEPAAWTKNFG